MNPDQLPNWLGEESLTRVQVENTTVVTLLDTGSRVNTLTPKFVQYHQLEVRPLSELVGDAPLTLSGLGGCRTRPEGYVVIRIRIDEVSGYDEDQIALVVKDDSDFARRVPLILGTPALRRIVNVMKESELDKLSIPWACTRKNIALADIRLNRCNLNPEITSRIMTCLLYTSPSPRDGLLSRMPSSA